MNLRVSDIYTEAFYSAIKKNEILLFARKWKEVEIIMLSETNQSYKNSVTCFFPHVQSRRKKVRERT
jgi:hypothetical protein